MHMKTMILAIGAVLALSGPALAACVNYPIVTPDTAPVDRVGYNPSGSNANLKGTTYTVAAFCPAAAAAGTCTGESLSEKVAGANYDYVTFDGIVPDIERHKNGFYIPLPGPDLFVPTTGYLPGAC